MSPKCDKVIFSRRGVQFNPEEMIYAQLYYAANHRRTFRVYCFEFNSGVLSMRRDARVSHRFTALIVVFYGISAVVA